MSMYWTMKPMTDHNNCTTMVRNRRHPKLSGASKTLLKLPVGSYIVDQYYRIVEYKEK